MAQLPKEEVTNGDTNNTQSDDQSCGNSSVSSSTGGQTSTVGSFRSDDDIEGDDEDPSQDPDSPFGYHEHKDDLSDHGQFSQDYGAKYGISNLTGYFAGHSITADTNLESVEDKQDTAVKHIQQGEFAGGHQTGHDTFAVSFGHKEGHSPHKLQHDDDPLRPFDVSRPMFDRTTLREAKVIEDTEIMAPRGGQRLPKPSHNVVFGSGETLVRQDGLSLPHAASSHQIQAISPGLQKRKDQQPIEGSKRRTPLPSHRKIAWTPTNQSLASDNKLTNQEDEKSKAARDHQNLLKRISS